MANACASSTGQYIGPTPGLRVEADPRHVEIQLKEMRLGEANRGRTPGVKDRGRSESTEHPLDRAESSMDRSCVTRANYLAQDQADIAYAAKESCRDMANPTDNSWEKIKIVVKLIIIIIIVFSCV